MEIIGILGVIWNAVIIDPMINSLVLLYSIFFNNFGVSILIFTVMMRGVMFPLTVRQSRQMKKMSEIQPKVKELQQRYAKDKQKISQETMRIYKEHGVNPIGCLGPMFLQFPIWIGLYRSILQILPAAPDSLVGLSGHLYSWLPRVHAVIPLDSSFLWLDLAEPDSLVLPIMVGASMYLMQKMTVMPSADPRQASTNRMMLWMMPLMFGFFTTSFPSGLAIYWIASNIVGVIIQGFITGWEPLTSLL
ncbi:MAG: membrane protein insertase YidC, partial [Chloroflexi bacterium]|nr:membrane protein insertase YidC [Chloroflexota bacterium]